MLETKIDDANGLNIDIYMQTVYSSSLYSYKIAPDQTNFLAVTVWPSFFTLLHEKQKNVLYIP